MSARPIRAGGERWERHKRPRWITTLTCVPRREQRNLGVASPDRPTANRLTVRRRRRRTAGAASSTTPARPRRTFGASIRGACSDSGCALRAHTRSMHSAHATARQGSDFGEPGCIDEPARFWGEKLAGKVTAGTGQNRRPSCRVSAPSACPECVSSARPDCAPHMCARSTYPECAPSVRLAWSVGVR